MLVLRGAPALSDFRLRKLEARLAAVLDRSVGVYAEHLHFAELDGALEAGQPQILEQPLRYGPSLPAHEPVGRLVLVVARPGTISPWSTKATDIAHDCGLSRVRRLERGTACYLTADDGELAPAEIEAVAGLLRDRMTQTTLFGTEEAYSNGAALSCQRTPDGDRPHRPATPTRMDLHQAVARVRCPEQNDAP